MTRFTILSDSLSCWFYYFASCLSIKAKQIPNYKDKAFQGKKYKNKNGVYLGQRGRRFCRSFVILSLLLKNKNKD